MSTVGRVRGSLLSQRPGGSAPNEGQSHCPSSYQVKNAQQSPTLTQLEHQTHYVSEEGQATVISERVIEHEVVVPKRIVREEVIEKVLVVPETVVREEIIEEVHPVKETIIEVAKPVYHEKIIEVPEIEYRDKIVEVVERVIEEKVKQVPKIEYQERIIEIPKHITQERIVEVPEYEYREVVIEKVVEVPEVREQVVVREIPIPRYIEKVVTLEDGAEPPMQIERQLPVPVESITTYEYQLSQYQPRMSKSQYPLYVPRFIEVPVAAEFFDSSQITEMHKNQERLKMLIGPQAPGLTEIEDLARDIRQQDFLNHQASPNAFQVALVQAWKTGQLQMAKGSSSHTTTEQPA